MQAFIAVGKKFGTTVTTQRVLKRYIWKVIVCKISGLVQIINKINTIRSHNEQGDGSKMGIKSLLNLLCPQVLWSFQLELNLELFV